MFKVKRLTASDIDLYRPDLVALLMDVVNGGSSVGFIAPLTSEMAHAFWDRIRGDVMSGSRVVLAAVAEDGEAHRVLGCVHLALATPLNGVHRAEVQKLLVHSQHRRRGIASALMEAAEAAAREHGKSLLVLDTESGSTADGLYGRWGFVRAGVIPRYAMNSAGTELIDTVVYYKLL